MLENSTKEAAKPTSCVCFSSPSPPPTKPMSCKKAQQCSAPMWGDSSLWNLLSPEPVDGSPTHREQAMSLGCHERILLPPTHILVVCQNSSFCPRICKTVNILVAIAGCKKLKRNITTWAVKWIPPERHLPSSYRRQHYSMFLPICWYSWKPSSIFPIHMGAHTELSIPCVPRY